MSFTHDEYNSPILWITVAAFLVSGCAAPVQVVHYRPGLQPAVIPAPRTDTYSLFTDGQVRVESTTLAVGDSVGFSTARGELEAIAGSDRVPLADGSYRWVIELSANGPFAVRGPTRAISKAASVENAKNFTRLLALLAGGGRFLR